MKFARTELGLTQTAWGRLLGITRDAVAKIEAGKRKPSQSVMILIGIVTSGKCPDGWPRRIDTSATQRY